MQNTIILLIEQIVVALGGEFKLYLPQLIPHMLRVFMHDNSTGRSVTMKVSALHWFVIREVLMLNLLIVIIIITGTSSCISEFLVDMQYIFAH